MRVFVQFLKLFIYWYEKAFQNACHVKHSLVLLGERKDRNCVVELLHFTKKVWSQGWEEMEIRMYRKPWPAREQQLEFRPFLNLQTQNNSRISKNTSPVFAQGFRTLCCLIKLKLDFFMYYFCINKLWFLYTHISRDLLLPRRQLLCWDTSLCNLTPQIKKLYVVAFSNRSFLI